MKDRIAKLLCRIFGHVTRNTTYEEWVRTRVNFVCTRCGKTWESFSDLNKEKRRH